jgi:hypothetical protein
LNLPALDADFLGSRVFRNHASIIRKNPSRAKFAKG